MHGRFDASENEPRCSRRSLLVAGGGALGAAVAPPVAGQSAADQSSSGWPGYGRDLWNTAASESGDLERNPKRQWDLNVKAPVESGIAVADGDVYAFGSDGDVYAVDESESVEVFAIGAGGEPYSDGGIAGTRTATPFLHEGALYVGGLDGTLYAIDRDSTSELWTYETDSPIRASPVVADGTAVLASRDGTIAALDHVGGSEQWTNTLEGGLHSTPAVSDSAVFVAGGSGRLTAIQTESGDEVWTASDSTTTPIYTAPTLSRSRVLVVEIDGTVVSFSQSDGTRDWDGTVPGEVIASPAAIQGELYVADRSGVVTALDSASGDRQWSVSVDAEIVADPAVSPSTVYVGTRDGTVVALDRSDGSKRWTTTLDSEIVSPLSIVDGTLYVGTVDGHIVSIVQDDSLEATALDYAEGAVGTVARNPLLAGGAAVAGIASIGGYAGFKRYRSDGTTAGEETSAGGRGPAGPGSGAAAADLDPIGQLPTDSDRLPDLSAATYDDFEVLEVIGSGGSADVRRAVIERGGREWTVALKTPRMSDYDTVDAGFFEEFVEEAEIWSQLDDHAWVVSVLGWGHQPHPWIALEYMDAGNLDERMDALSLESGLAHLERVCEAVHHAHRHGVTHTDLKPENVLYTSVDGVLVPKVTDWGLANVLLEHSASVEGMTPAYAAPEQIDPDAYGGTDDRTDVYQLGVVAYEMLTGQRPIERENTAATMNAILNERPEPPTAVAPDIDPALSEAVMRALEREKSRRYETALHFRDALRQAVQRGGT